MPVPPFRSVGSFIDVYRRNCQLLKAYPLSFVTTPAFHQSRILKIPADKVQHENDWAMLCLALELANDLKSIIIWSTWWYNKQQQLLRLNKTRELSQSKKNITSNMPLILQVSIVQTLVNAISNALSNCHQLTELTMDGIILTHLQIRTIAREMIGNSSLKYLSFCRCSLGDAGVNELCPAIKNLSSLNVLLLCDNQLTKLSAGRLSDALKSQSVRRIESAFPYLLRTSGPLKPHKHTLNESPPILPSNMYLRRVDLSCNPLQDEGLEELLDAVENDVGLVVIDLQRAEITDVGLQNAWRVIKRARFAPAIDLRRNPDIQDLVTLTKVLAHGRDQEALDSDLARAPDDVDPLFKSLHIPASYATRISMTGIQKPTANGKKVKRKANPSAKPLPKPPIARAAWRPAGRLQPRKSSNHANNDDEGSIQKKAKPYVSQPTIDVDGFVATLGNNRALSTKVRALELALLNVVDNAITNSPTKPIPEWRNQQNYASRGNPQPSYIQRYDGMSQVDQGTLMHQPSGASDVASFDPYEFVGAIGLGPHGAVAAPKPPTPIPQSFEITEMGDGAQRKQTHVRNLPGTKTAFAPASEIALIDSTQVQSGLSSALQRILNFGEQVRQIDAQFRAGNRDPWAIYHTKARVRQIRQDLDHALIASREHSDESGKTPPHEIPLKSTLALLTQALDFLDKQCKTAEKRQWDKHPELMSRISDVEKWVTQTSAQVRPDLDDLPDYPGHNPITSHRTENLAFDGTKRSPNSRSTTPLKITDLFVEGEETHKEELPHVPPAHDGKTKRHSRMARVLPDVMPTFAI